MYRSKRSRIAQASKGKDTVHDTDQVIHDVDQDPETMLNSSRNHSMTGDLSPTQPLEIDTSHGLGASQRRSFQVQDTELHPIQDTGTGALEAQVGSYHDFWADDPLGTEPTRATMTDANDVRPNQRNTAGRQSLAPPPSQSFPNDSPRRRRGRPSKRQSFQEDDEEPVDEGFSTQRKKNFKWSDEIEFDETEEVEMRDSNGKRGTKGGKILSRHVWSLQPGVRFVVPLNALDQPVGKGGSILLRFLKDVAKNGELSPIGEVSWPKVDKGHKADIIALIREKFVLPPRLEIDKSILKHVGNKWRSYRHELKVLYKKPDMTEEQVASAVPKGVVPSQWVKLVQYWFSDKYEILSAKGKEARAALSHLHTAGSKSFARMRDEFERKHGREPGAVEWFVQTHKRKDGTFIEDTSKEFLDIAASMIAERAPTSPSQRVAIENQVFNELMYSDEDERYQRPIGYGFGVNTKKIFGVEGELRRRGYARSGTMGEAASFIQSQKLRVKGEPKESGYMEADNSAEVERLSFSMEAMSETNELMQAQLEMQAKQLKKQSERLQMQSERMDGLQAQLQQVTSLLTKFGVMLNNGPIHPTPKFGVMSNSGPTHSTPRGVSRRGVDFADTQVAEESAESDDGESASSEWDSE